MPLIGSRKTLPLEYQRGGQPMVIDGQAPASAYRDGQPGVMDSSFEYAPAAQKASILAGALSRAREAAGQFGGNGGWTGYSMGQSDPYAQSAPNYGPAPGGSPYQQRMAAQDEGMPQSNGMLQDAPVLGGMADRAPMAALPSAPKQGHNWAGILSDFLGGLAGQGPNFAIQQQQARQRLQEAQMAEVQWSRREQWKQQHPDPRYFEANNGDQMVVGPDGQPRTIYKDPTPKTNWVAVEDGRGGKQLIPFVNGVPMGQGQTAPQAQPEAGGFPPDAVARLRANPHEAAQFDSIFGTGASQRALGGAGSQGPATFR